MTKEIQETDSLESGKEPTGPVRTLIPAVDIQELADAYVVRLDIPGADKGSISVKVEGSNLDVVAAVSEYFPKDSTLKYDDSIPAEYRRSFTLANDVETGSIEALYELGVLKIVLKKKQQFLPKAINIR